MSQHVVPVRVYISVFAALIALTGITTVVAYKDLGAMNTVAALTIAVAKMLLVVLFFMHVRHSSGLTKVVLLAAAFWLALLLTLTLSDELTRHWTPTPSDWGPAVDTSAPR
jgi:cytochrome c oxidase subunit 4